MRASPWAGLLVLLAGCSGAAATHGDVSTVADTTADSIIVRVTGEVAATNVRHLVPEVQIAPGIDDTTLFTSVWEFDVDPWGRLYVFDNDSRSVLRFAPDGSLIDRIGREGAGPGEFRQNGGMVILPGGELAQWDSRNARITIFDTAGMPRQTWPVPGGFSTSNGLYTDHSGRLYLRRPVTAPREGEILGRMGLVALDSGGVFADSLEPPDLEVPREMYVAVQEGGRSSMGSRYAPTYHWAWLPAGQFVVAHGGRYEMIIARDDGLPIVVRRELAPVPVDAQEIADEEASITWSLRQTEPGWSWRGPPLPTSKAPLTGLVATRDGRIWARVAVPSEEIPEAELVPPRDSTQPVLRHRMPAVYEVFSAEGRFLGRVALPPRTQLVDADGDTVWGLALDEFDMAAVSRYRIEPGLP
jgi:hypothetical protein